LLGIVQGEFPVEDTSGDVDRVVCRAVRHASASASASCVVPTPGCAVSAVILGRRCVHVLVNCTWESVKSQGVRKKKGDTCQKVLRHLAMTLRKPRRDTPPATCAI